MKWIKRNNVSSIQEAHLKNLGVKSTSEINQWVIDLRKNNCKIQNMEIAIQMLRDRCNDHIFICGDYDCDGVMAVTILYHALKKSGEFPHLHYRIPRRFSEGYGLSCSLVDQIHDFVSGPITLLTCDNGIAAFDAIQRAKEYGMHVIVTDHHLGVTDERTGELLLPDADVIIDPSAIPNSADFSGYCGAGIAYKLVCEMYGTENCKQYLPLAATATIADVMELQGENYAIVREGLKFLNTCDENKMCLPGLSVLAHKMPKYGCLTSEDVAFQIVPVINAPGRLFDDGAYRAVELMLASRLKAVQLVNDLIAVNEERKRIVKEALATIPNTIDENQKVLVKYIPNINLGVVGIVAGELCEKYKRPTIIFTEDTTDPMKLRGSARSISGIHIKNVLDDTTTLDHYGGHAGAAGLGLRKENLDAFVNELNDIFEEIDIPEDDVQIYDFEIAAKDIPAALSETEKYGPFGQGNPKLVFKISNFEVLPYNGEYKKLLNGDGIRLNSRGMAAVGFGLAPQMSSYQKPTHLTLYGSLSTNVFHDRATPQIQFVDFDSVKEASLPTFSKKL